MEKTHNTCERRLRLPWSPCYPQGWTTWPHAACDDNSWEKYRGFEGRLVKPLSGNYNMNRMDLVENLHRQLAGWAAFYQYTNYTATLFGRLDRTVFWKLGYWPAKVPARLQVADARPYSRTGAEAQTKTWVLQGQNSRGWNGAAAIRRLVTSRKGRFSWRSLSEKLYIMRDGTRRIIESRYADIAFARSNARTESRMR